MTTFRFIVFFAALVLTSLLFWPPGPVFADGTLPDGCLGTLSDDQVVVYYFHRKFRCQSCEVLESTLVNTMRVVYADHFGSGRLAMCVINLDDPENRHYLDKFEIFSNSVIIAQKKGGNIYRFKAVESVWDVSEDRDAISHVLQKEVGQFLPGS